MSPTLWENLLSILNHPVYGKVIAAAIIILVAWVTTCLIGLLISRWHKVIVARAGEVPFLARSNEEHVLPSPLAKARRRNLEIQYINNNDVM